MHSSPRVVSFPGRPQPISIDIRRSAVLVIDMQNEFGSEGGMFDRAGIDISIIRRAISPTAAVRDAASKNGVPIIYLKMQHRPDMADMGHEDSPHRIKHGFFAVGESNVAPDGSPNRVLIDGYW